MKISKIKIAGIFFLLLPVALYAQSGQSKLDRLQVSGVTLKEVSDTLQMNFRLGVDKMGMKGMERMVVTPCLVGEAGERLELKPCVVDGKQRERWEYRSAILESRKTKPEYLAEYVYDEQVPFERWMDRAHLVIRGVTDDGINKGNTYHRFLGDTVTLEFKLPSHRYVMVPQVDFMMPDVEPMKVRNESGKAFLAFNVGNAHIMPTLKNNAIELAKITNAIDTISSDENIIIKGIAIHGYASLDGSAASNLKLSGNRSASLVGYLKEMYKIDNSIFSNKGMGEDWSTLRQYVESIDAPYKAKVLSIIDSNVAPDAKLEQVKRAMGTVDFRVVELTVFPQQRRVEYRLDYAVKDFTVEQGSQIIRKHPGRMSLNEMFHVANSYERGGKEFNEVFDIAVRVFPDNPVANLNAASAAILKGDTIAAGKYLEKLGDSPAAYNNKAALYMLEGDTSKAKVYLEKAAAHSMTEQVRHNLQEIERKEEDNKLFDKYIRK